jgi:DNA-binding Lrp family transcriptional regulator
MNSVLELLLEGENLDTEQMSKILNLSAAEVEKELKDLQKQKILLGWRPVINPETFEENVVRAVIEVKISPEREGGFDRLAMRISQFDAVESCYLMSGGYDILIFTKGNNLRQIASFVSEKLATIGGILSTSTHFMLRSYKEQGHMLVTESAVPDKPAISA